jgi:hypothetical protein
MSPTYPGLANQAGSIKKSLACLLCYVGIEQAAILVLQIFVAGMCTDHCSYFYAEDKFETFVTVQGICSISQLNWSFKVCGLQFDSFEMRSIRLIGKTQRWKGF